MKTLLCTSPHHFAYADTPRPIVSPGETLLRIRRIGVCGTDLHAFEGTQPYFTYPRILGHELAAIIEETDAAGFRQGDAVTVIPYFNCGHCIACRTGKPNCCVSMQVCGVHVDGGMREFLVVPSAALVQGEGLSLDELALVEPLSIGAHAVSRAGVGKNEFVLVAGAGPIGLGTMEFARIAGATVIALDMQESRLEFCRRQLGIPYTIDAKTNVQSALQRITNGDMPTVVIDATGNLAAMTNAFRYLAHGGRYVLVGLQKEAISFSHPEFHKREATLMSSRNATREDFEHVLDCMRRKLVNPATYITHRVGFDEVKDTFPAWLDPKNGTIKAMIEL
jgi:2-desacetyl-2-hydroxyethyl bacteriochlorophyllide A dehydrogenase